MEHNLNAFLEVLTNPPSPEKYDTEDEEDVEVKEVCWSIEVTETRQFLEAQEPEVRK